MVVIKISKSAQHQVWHAIEWGAKHYPKQQSKAFIKSVINDWKNQLLVMPESGVKSELIASDSIREIVKQDYRFTYEIQAVGNDFYIDLLVFCHTKMNYVDLLKYSRLPLK